MKLNSEYQKFNAFRRPDWRFERVLEIVDRVPSPGRCTRRDDEYVRLARSFVMRWRSKETRAEREPLYWENPGLFYAYEIFEAAEDEPEPALFIEARLLAKQTPEAIAEAVSTSPDAVEWYERLFFNVSDRLANRDWVTKHVLMPAVTGKSGGPNGIDEPKAPAITRRFLDGSLKMFAYFGGEHMVDVMLSGFQHGKPLRSPDDLHEWLDGQWRTTIRRRSAQAALQFDVNKYNVMQLFELHNQIRAIEQSSDGKDQQRNATERHIKAMMDNIPWVSGDAGRAVADDSRAAGLDDGAAEMRDDELILAGAGAPNREALEEVRNLKMPPPSKKKFALERKGALEDDK